VDDEDNVDDNVDEPNDSDPEEAMDDALENFDDDDEDDDDMDDAMLENGVPFIHVFSPRQQLDSDSDTNTDDEDLQQLEQFDISLPGQHLVWNCPEFWSYVVTKHIVIMLVEHNSLLCGNTIHYHVGT
jgi:hypothetical protein